MSALSHDQLVRIVDLTRLLEEAKVKAGTLRDGVEAGSLVGASLGIVEAELRLLAALCRGMQQADGARPDLRVAFCDGCGRVTYHRDEQGVSRCVMCGTVNAVVSAPTLKAVKP